MASPGRPKKDVTQTVLTNNTESVNFSHTALGICKDPSTGEWQLVKVKYDPVTKQSSTIEFTPASEKELAMERFKVEAGRNLFGKSE